MSDNLKDLRNKLDAVDDKMIDLLVERADLAEEVRRVKSSELINTYHPEREREILERMVAAGSKAGLSRDNIERVFLSIISACRSIIGELDISTVGTFGGIAHAAAAKQFGVTSEFIPVERPEELVLRVEQGSSRYGLIRISDYRGGVLSESLRLLATHEVQIIDELAYKESYVLLTMAPSEKDIEEVHVAPEVLPNVVTWLEQHVPAARIRKFRQEPFSFQSAHPKAGIVVPIELAGLFGTPSLRKEITLNEEYAHRFFLISKKEQGQVDSSHTTKVFVCIAENRSGILREILRPFEEAGVELECIESRIKVRSDWECLFYIEVKLEVGVGMPEEIQKSLMKCCLHVADLGGFDRRV